MDSQELTPELIIEWASSHASNEELERTAKGVYSVYKDSQPVDKRKLDKIKKHKAKDAMYWRYKKSKSKKLDTYEQKPYVKPTTEHRK